MTKRAELILISTCALIFFISFFAYPIFPVQRYPLFADSPTRYESYFIFSKSTGEVPPISLELQNTYDGDPTYLVGRLPPTIYKWGEILTPQALETHLRSLVKQQRLTADPLCIQKTVWSTRSDKSFGPESIQQFAWSNETLSTENSLIQTICHGGESQ